MNIAPGAEPLKRAAFWMRRVNGRPRSTLRNTLVPDDAAAIRGGEMDRPPRPGELLDRLVKNVWSALRYMAVGPRRTMPSRCTPHEDVATAEIARPHVWQGLRRGMAAAGDGPSSGRSWRIRRARRGQGDHRGRGTRAVSARIHPAAGLPTLDTAPLSDGEKLPRSIPAQSARSALRAFHRHELNPGGTADAKLNRAPRAHMHPQAGRPGGLDLNAAATVDG